MVSNHGKHFHMTMNGETGIAQYACMHTHSEQYKRRRTNRLSWEAAETAMASARGAAPWLAPWRVALRASRGEASGGAVVDGAWGAAAGAALARAGVDGGAEVAADALAGAASAQPTHLSDTRRSRKHNVCKVDCRAQAELGATVS